MFKKFFSDCKIKIRTTTDTINAQVPYANKGTLDRYKKDRSRITGKDLNLLSHYLVLAHKVNFIERSSPTNIECEDKLTKELLEEVLINTKF